MKGKTKTIMCAALSALLVAGLASCTDVELGGGTGDTTVISSGKTGSKAENSIDRGSSSASDNTAAPSESDGSFTISGPSVSRSGSVYTISAKGDYILSGTLAEGQVVVNVSDSDDVTLVLDGVDISCSTGAPILIESADNAVISVRAGSSNTVTDKRTAVEDTDGTNYDGAIYAACDLELAGTGSLTVNALSAENGVKSKDDLEVSDLTLKVTSSGSALKGNDSVTVHSGTLELISTSLDGIKTSNTDVSSKGNQKGNVVIEGGTVSIKASSDGIDAAFSAVVSGGSLSVACGDDAIHAEEELVISGGNVIVSESHEGLEGNVVTISGGNIDVYATDDGINATEGTRNSASINITGGYVTVTTSSGDTDAIDSNGNFTMSGGTVIVRGGSSFGGMAGSVDADGTIKVTGGTIIAFGGICKLPSDGSVNTYVSSGTEFQAGSYTLKDSSGTEIAAFELDSSYRSVWISSGSLKLNGSFTLSRGSETVLSWTQTSSVEGYSGGGSGFPGGGSRGGGWGGQGGGRGWR